MHFLVTGVAGFIGSHVAEAALAEGHQVTGVDGFIPYYPQPVKQRNLARLGETDAFRFVELDLRTDSLAPLFEEQVDVVINEAAMPGLPRSWVDFEAYSSCNILLVQRLLDACREHQVPRIVHASSSSVYGTDAVGDEQIPTRPVSPYGTTKLAAEHLLYAYHVTFGIDTQVLRYFSIFGPRQRPDMAYNRFIAAMRAGDPILVFGDGLQTRSSTFVGDAVRATMAAAQTTGAGDIYNIGGGEVVSVLEVIDFLADVLGVKPVLQFEGPRAGDQRRTEADYSKAEGAFGYRPSTSVFDGLRQQVEWQLAQPVPTTSAQDTNL